MRVKTAKGPAGWLPAHRVWPALSFARVAIAEPNTRFYKKMGEQPVANPLRKARELPVLSSNPPWFELQLSEGASLWAMFEDLKARDTDLGFGYLLRPVKVAEKSGGFHLTQGTRFHPLALGAEGKLQVRLIDGPRRGQVVWLNKADTLSKLNFSESVRTELKAGSELDAGPSLQKLISIQTPSRWLLTGHQKITLHAEPREGSAATMELPPSSPLALAESDWQIWNLSPSMTKGVSWWLKHSRILNSEAPLKPLSHQEVFSRPIFDMASAAQGGVPLTVVSAGGIFLRRAQNHWEPVRQFADRNYPVSITSAGTILVGDHISKDGGQSFEPMIAWGPIMSQIEKANVRPKILKIQPQNASGTHLIYHLDVGGGSLVVAETRDEGATWKVKAL